MNIMRQLRYLGILCGAGFIFAGCSASDASEPDAGSVSNGINPGMCKKAEPKDVLIAELVKDAWVAGYPLTRLSVNGAGAIVGVNMPDIVAGDVDLINNVPAAHDSVVQALADIAGLPDYGVGPIGPDTEACTGIPAWTPSGTTHVDTKSNSVSPVAPNANTWTDVQQAFGKVCPLIKRLGNKNIIDPPGDGSTSLPESETVSSTGVTANAFGWCPAGTPVGTYCKMSYATGINYTGRSCQFYAGALRCLVY